jgi:hypothetical protein
MEQHRHGDYEKNKERSDTGGSPAQHSFPASAADGLVLRELLIRWRQRKLE